MQVDSNPAASLPSGGVHTETATEAEAAPKATGAVPSPEAAPALVSPKSDEPPPQAVQRQWLSNEPVSTSCSNSSNGSLPVSSAAAKEVVAPPGKPKGPDQLLADMFGSFGALLKRTAAPPTDVVCCTPRRKPPVARPMGEDAYSSPVSTLSAEEAAVLNALADKRESRANEPAFSVAG